MKKLDFRDQDGLLRNSLEFIRESYRLDNLKEAVYFCIESLIKKTDKTADKKKIKFLIQELKDRNISRIRKNIKKTSYKAYDLPNCKKRIIRMCMMGCADNDIYEVIKESKQLAKYHDNKKAWKEITCLKKDDIPVLKHNISARVFMDGNSDKIYNGYSLAYYKDKTKRIINE